MTPAGFDKGWLSRERALAIALLVMTGIAFYLCYLLALPFFTPLAWGLALAVVAHPLHHHLATKIRWRSVSAALSVLIVAVVILLPAVFVVHQIFSQAATLAQGENTFREGSEKESSDSGKNEDSGSDESGRSENAEEAPSSEKTGEEEDKSGGDKGGSQSATAQKVIARMESDPRLGKAREWIKTFDLRSQADGFVRYVASLAPNFVKGGVWVGAQFLITLLVLFYFFRDRRQVTETVRGLLPLSDSETDDAFQRIEDTIYATIFGSLTVALLQGVLGGLMFWFLGLPAPFIWGAVMALLATIPMLGTFVIWLPAAIYLAFTGELGKAAILVAWGAIAIAMIDNLLYPVLVGKRLQFHPLLVFISIVGGLAIFGAAGIILGPLVLSVTDALINVWRERTEDGGKLEEGVREG